MVSGRTGQDDLQTIYSEVQLVFRKQTRGQVIGAEPLRGNYANGHCQQQHDQ